jgi:hypothetical protein
MDRPVGWWNCRTGCSGSRTGTSTDVAATLDRYTRQQLIELGRRADPALTDEEFADAMRRLDRLDDSVFTLYGYTPDQVTQIRTRFADWPRA